MEAAKYIAVRTAPDGGRSVEEFDRMTDGIRWALAAQLQPGEHVNIYFKGERIYNKAYSPAEDTGSVSTEAEALLVKLANKFNE